MSNFSEDLVSLSDKIARLSILLVSGKVFSTRRGFAKKSLMLQVREFVKKCGVSSKEFEEKCRAKNLKNGGFKKGFVLREKVLPLGEGDWQKKIVRDDKKDTASGAQKLIAETSTEGIRPTPEKLVRDGIPAIIEMHALENWELICRQIAKTENASLTKVKKRASPLKNYKAKVRVAGNREMLKLLREKLKEEATEFRSSVMNNEPAQDVLEDLGDILEIIKSYGYFEEKLKIK